MALFIGVDIGTQGAKALVYDVEKRSVISRGSQPYDIIKTNVPGRAEQNPSSWIEGGCSAINACLSTVDRRQVKAIGVSGQQHGLVPLDKTGKVIRNAKLWCDVEAAQEAKQLSEKFEFTVVPGFTAPKILWLKNNEPDNFSALRHVLLPHDYWNYWLTGRFVMECGDASGTGVFDTVQRKLDEDKVAAIDDGLMECFPPLIGENEVVGTLCAEAAEKLGLQQDVIVSPGGGDNMMSALGSGAVKEGVLVMSLGTSGTLFGCSSRPIVDPSGSIAPFCDCTGQWLPLLCTQNCTLVPDEVLQVSGSSHSHLTGEAEREPPGSCGINFLPYLTGERTPNWPHATAAIVGLRAGQLKPGLLYRAAMEGATFSLLSGYKRFEEYGVRSNELYLVGGGSKNRLWRQIVSDSLQLPVRLPLEPESAALGAALQAAAVFFNEPIAEFVLQNPPAFEDEVVVPNESARSAMEEAFERHVTMSNAMFMQ